MVLNPALLLKIRAVILYKRPALWAMGIGFAFIAIGYNAVTTHEVSFITDMKVSGNVAAAALALVLCRVYSRAGWLTD